MRAKKQASKKKASRAPPWRGKASVQGKKRSLGSPKSKRNEHSRRGASSNAKKKHVVKQKPAVKRNTKSLPRVAIRKVPPLRVESEIIYPIKNRENEALNGSLHEPLTKTDTIIIAVHGFLSTKNQLLTRSICLEASRAGYAAYRFDLSGNGDSEGRFEDGTARKHLNDLLTVIEHFRARYAKLYLLGLSLGGTLCLATASRVKVDGVISVAAPMHPERYAQSLSEPQQEQLRSVGFTILLVKRGTIEVPYTLTTQYIEENAQVQPLAVAKDILCPVLLVHGTADTRVPVQDTEEIAEALVHKDILLIGGAPHNIAAPEHVEAVISGVLSWLEKQAKSSHKR